jgi:hypothetical protein
VKEGIEKVTESFKSIESMGPVAVADFLELPDGDERDRIIRDAFEVMKYVLDKTQTE